MEQKGFKVSIKRITGWVFKLGFDSYLKYYPYEQSPYEITRFAQLIASHDSAKFMTENLLKAKNCYSESGLLEYALNEAKIEGQILEFGVWTGGTITKIAEVAKDRKVVGFDSFEGLDYQWRHDVNLKMFDMDGQLPSVPKNVTLVKGYFENSLPAYLKDNQTPVSFLHIDSDIYESAKTVLENLKDQIVAGTVIVFDEFFNYVGWQQHEYRAFEEFVKKYNKKHEYIGFASGHLSVAVRIL